MDSQKHNSAGSDKDIIFAQEMNKALDFLLELEGRPVQLSQICNRPGAAVLKPFFAEEYAGALHKWYDATELFDELRHTLLPAERAQHIVKSATEEVQAKKQKGKKAQAEADDWHALEEVQAQESYDEVEAELVAEDRLMRLRAADGYKRKYGAAASSSTDGTKRTTTARKDSSSMEVDKATGEVSDVDFDELHEV